MRPEANRPDDKTKVEVVKEIDNQVRKGESAGVSEGERMN